MSLSKSEKAFVIKLIGTKGLDSLTRYLSLNNPSTDKDVLDLMARILWLFINKIEEGEVKIIKEAFKEIDFE